MQDLGALIQEFFRQEALGLVFRGIGSLLLLSLVSHWRLLEKAGEPGWKTLIPVYNLYTLAKIAYGRSRQMWLSLALPFLSCALCGVTALDLTGKITSLLATMPVREPLVLLFFSFPVLVLGTAALFAVFLTFSLVLLPIMIAPISVKLARRFGKDGLPFALGMVFLYPVFAAILAFGDAQYRPPAAWQSPQPWERAPGGAAADHQQEDTAP